MKDINRVRLIQLMTCLPLCVVLLFILATSIRVTTLIPTELFFLFIISTGFGWILFLKSPRLQHYMRALAEFEENYRYEKEAQ